MLGFSGVAQAGYMLAGVVVGTQLGVSATVLYLIAYLSMNIAAFAVIHAQQTETGDDRIAGLRGLGKRSPALAWSLTVPMLGLAGIPGTVGFVGKFQLIHALVDGGYSWLAIVLVVGAMISLGYYLKVVAAVWMSPAAEHHEISDVADPGRGRAGGLAPIAGGSPEADKLPVPRSGVRRGLLRRAQRRLRDPPGAALPPRGSRGCGPHGSALGLLRHPPRLGLTGSPIAGPAWASDSAHGVVEQRPMQRP